MYRIRGKVCEGCSSSTSQCGLNVLVRAQELSIKNSAFVPDFENIVNFFSFFKIILVLIRHISTFVGIMEVFFYLVGQYS